MKAIAREALETFEPISNAAQRSLGERGITLNALASINEMTASNVAAEMQQINDRRRSDWVKLRREPAIARLVVADEDNSRETLYISSGGTVGLPPTRLIHVGAQAPVNNAPPNAQRGRNWTRNGGHGWTRFDSDSPPTVTEKSSKSLGTGMRSPNSRVNLILPLINSI